MAQKRVHRQVKQKVRKGKWWNLEDKERFSLESLPQEVQKRMNEENPDWDWAEFSTSGHEWILVREYDEGEETVRVAALV